MKQVWSFLVLAAAITVVSCNPKQENRYVDLNTGEAFELREDSTSGIVLNASTGKPVDLYVDTQTKDTVYGRTKKVVNGSVIRTEEGHWVVKGEGDEYKAKSADDAKIKTEGEEYKEKDGNVTRKVDKDGDVKIEDGNKTIKIDGKTGERKVKKDHNITDKVKKVFHK